MDNFVLVLAQFIECRCHSVLGIPAFYVSLYANSRVFGIPSGNTQNAKSEFNKRLGQYTFCCSLRENTHICMKR